MTIAYRTRSATNGATSATPTTPTGLATGEGILAFVSVKPDTATINTPTGWTLIADVAGGGGSAGSQVGPTRQAVFFREKDPSWSTTPAFTATGANIVAAAVFVFTKSATATWGMAAATGTWGSAGTTTDATTTLGSNPGIEAGDAAVVNYTNMASAPNWSAQSVDATGISAWGATSDVFKGGSGSFGNAISAAFFWVPVTTGTATAAPVTHGTVTSAGRGTVSLVRLREVVAGATIITGGQATETDEAFAGTTTAGQVVTGGQATETSTVFAGAVLAAALILGGQAVEVDTARAGVTVRGDFVTGTRALETDEARAGSIVASSIIAGGQAGETDEARAGSVSTAGDSYPDTVLADSPVAYYRLGEPSGTTLVDSSGNGHDGTYVNTPTLGTPGLADPSDTSVDFDGSTKYANVPNGAWADVSTGVTIEAWIRPDTLPGVGDVAIVDRSDSGVASVRLSVSSTGQVRFWLYRTGIGSTVKSTAGGLVNPGQTHHVVGTYDGSVVRIYVNGSFGISSSESGTLSTVGTPPLRIGATADDLEHFNGRIDEVAYYDHGLTADRIDAHYAAKPVDVTLTGTRVIETDAALHGTVLGGNVTILGSQAAETDEALAGDVAAPATTDTTNRVGGRRRGGYAVATWDPPIVDPPPTIVLGEARDRANAFGAVTMNGTQAVYDVTTATRVRHRDRIVVGGKDITYWRGVRTPLPTYQLVSPLLYGPATMRLPQVAAAFEQVGVGDLSWLQPGKPVKVQRVDPETGEVVAVDHKGLVIAFNASGRDLTVEIGGEASGRAALMEKQLPIFRSTHDIGQIAAFAMMPLKVPFLPHRGPTTGIKLARFGGTGWLDYIAQLCARAWTRSGTQWTIMPGADGAYRMTRKDTTTVDATAYLDDARTVGDLRRDIAEEHNRFFITGITPDGQRVMFAAFPGLQKTRPAPYPFNDNRTFGAGTTDAETDTGDGITVMVKRLNMFGIVAVDDAPGGFDADITKAIRDLQEDAELPVTGDMNPATWRALYDLDATGWTLRDSEVQPAAQKSYTKPWLRSPSGAIMRRNPNYDPARLWVDRVIDMGSGFTKDQMREYAVTLLEKSEDNWVGTITFHTGGLVSGSHGHSFTPTTDDVFRARRLKPGMNIRLPHSPGGDITVHVSAVSVDEDGKVTATVDTQARDSMAVWEVIERNRESRRDPARQWIRDHRASGQIKDAIDGWWAPGGKLGSNITVPGHTWTMVEIVAGQEGTVQALRVRTNPNAEYVMAVSGRKISPKRLARLIGNPLTKRGAKRWADEGVRNQLDRDKFLLYVAGDEEQPLGYYPKSKRPDTEVIDNPDYDPTADEDSTGTDDEPEIEVETGSTTPLTGRWEDAAGFSYRTFLQPVLYVYIYADRPTSIPAGRIMWPQLEAGA